MWVLSSKKAQWAYSSHVAPKKKINENIDGSSDHISIFPFFWVF